MNFESITVKQGLPANRVNCIAKDSLGFIWYGTLLGLVRSDGITLETFEYDPDDEYGLPSESMVKLMVAKSGIIRGLTSEGYLFSFDPYALNGKYIKTYSIGAADAAVRNFTTSKDRV